MPEPGKAIKDLTLCPLAYGAAVGGASGGVVGSLASLVARRYGVDKKECLQLIAGVVGGIVGAIAGGRMGFALIRGAVGAIGGTTAGGSSGATVGYKAAAIIHDGFKVEGRDK